MWRFREALTTAGVVKRLFDQFTAELARHGALTKAGVIVDASIVEVPRQRNTREENAAIKAGQTPAAWTEQPHKLAQKDVEARWTKKGGVTFYGYKDHVRTDAGTVLITDYVVTAASVHDSQVLPELVGSQDQGAESLGGQRLQKCGDRRAVAALGRGQSNPRKRHPQGGPQRGAENVQPPEVEDPLLGRTHLRLYREQYARSGTRISRVGPHQHRHRTGQPDLQSLPLRSVDPTRPRVGDGVNCPDTEKTTTSCPKTPSQWLQLHALRQTPRSSLREHSGNRLRNQENALFKVPFSVSLALCNFRPPDTHKLFCHRTAPVGTRPWSHRRASNAVTPQATSVTR